MGAVYLAQRSMEFEQTVAVDPSWFNTERLRRTSPARRIFGVPLSPEHCAQLMPGQPDGIPYFAMEEAGRFADKFCRVSAASTALELFGKVCEVRTRIATSSHRDIKPGNISSTRMASRSS
jgi:hypothetical protein